MSKRAKQRGLEAAQQYYDDNSICCSESLTKEIFAAGYEQAEKDLGWISVKNRLPEENKWVFVCVDMQGVPQCVGLGYLKDGEWCDDENDNGFCVDYWMEIPKFKEEEV